MYDHIGHDQLLATSVAVFWEIQNLRVETVSVVFDVHMVMVRRSWSRQRLGPTKTRRTRVVSLVHPVSEDTLEWRPGLTPESRRILAMLRALPVRSLEPGDFLFGIKHPWATWAIQAQWRQVLGAAGVRYRNPEQLRHTFASTLLSRNAPLLYVQQQGGWQSAAVLLRVYARWLPQGQVDATPAQPAARGVPPIANEIADFEPFSRPAETSRSS